MDSTLSSLTSPHSRFHAALERFEAAINDNHERSDGCSKSFITNVAQRRTKSMNTAAELETKLYRILNDEPDEFGRSKVLESSSPAREQDTKRSNYAKRIHVHNIRLKKSLNTAMEESSVCQKSKTKILVDYNQQMFHNSEPNLSFSPNSMLPSKDTLLLPGNTNCDKTSGRKGQSMFTAAGEQLLRRAKSARSLFTKGSLSSMRNSTSHDGQLYRRSSRPRRYNSLHTERRVIRLKRKDIKNTNDDNDNERS